MTSNPVRSLEKASLDAFEQYFGFGLRILPELEKFHATSRFLPARGQIPARFKEQEFEEKWISPFSTEAWKTGFLEKDYSHAGRVFPRGMKVSRAEASLMPPGASLDSELLADVQELRLDTVVTASVAAILAASEASEYTSCMSWSGSYTRTLASYIGTEAYVVASVRESGIKFSRCLILGGQDGLFVLPTYGGSGKYRPMLGLYAWLRYLGFEHRDHYSFTSRDGWVDDPTSCWGKAWSFPPKWVQSDPMCPLCGHWVGRLSNKPICYDCQWK